jgi:hypothetical protein
MTCDRGDKFNMYAKYAVATSCWLIEQPQLLVFIFPTANQRQDCGVAMKSLFFSASFSGRHKTGALAE